MYSYVRAFVILEIIPLSWVILASAGKLPQKTSKTLEEKSLHNGLVSSYFKRNSLGPNTYAFGYEINDKQTGNVQFRDERQFVNGSVEGSFGYVRPDGRVTVTRFLADNTTGYMSRTNIFEPNDKNDLKDVWPIQRPVALIKRPDNPPLNMTYDKQRHLNVSVGYMPTNVTNSASEQHKMQLNSIDLEQGAVDPLVNDIVNGKIPLQRKKTGEGQVQSPGFQTVQNFIPADFPIVPFNLTEKMLDSRTEKTLPATTKTTKQNVLQTPKPLVTDADNGHGNGNLTWYDEVIKQSRKEFLKQKRNSQLSF